MRRKPIGLTGGIATGKTYVSRIFKSLGAYIISGDDIAAKVLVPGSPAITDLRNTFGDRIILKNGGLNRKEMLDILLENRENMWRQLHVLAPYILPAIDKAAGYALLHHPGSLVIVEAPLLFEYGRRERYGPIITVFAPLEIQVQRLAKRSGMDVSRAEKIVNLQIPIQQKVAMSDYVIDNSGDKEKTAEAVKKLYGKLLESLYE